MKIKCLECGCVFNKYLSQIKKYPLHFCSKSCASFYKGKKRKILVKIKCLNCNKELSVIPSEAKYRKFCNHICAGIFNNKGKIKKRTCLFCGKSISNKKYCSHKCQHDLQAEEYIKKWHQGLVSGTSGNTVSKTLRKYLLKQSGYKCQECGWNKINPILGTEPLHVNHFDGNSRNNKKGNHEVLCPSCHSLTPNWGQLNKGKGRKSRKMGISLRSTQKEYKCTDCGIRISKGSLRCKSCDEKIRVYKRKAIIPKEELLAEVRNSNFSVIGRKYGVSSNTIRKWLKIKNNKDLQTYRPTV